MKTKEIFFQKTIETIVSNKHLRPLAVKQLDNYMFKKFSQIDSNVIYDEELTRLTENIKEPEFADILQKI